MHLRNIKLIVEYDGTPFHGFQAQAEAKTVQCELEQAILRITGQFPTLRVAGRTDTGVHAVGQVVNFKTASKLSPYRIAAGINAVIHKHISIQQAEEMPLDFDARNHARWKRYRYTIYQAAFASAQLRFLSWHIIKKLDVPAMRQAATYLIGEHDFESFRHAQCQAPHARRRMMDIVIEKKERTPAGEILSITYRADAFCRHMCRILTGTLVEIGKGSHPPEWILSLLHARARTLAGMTAPARGLCLLEVSYH